MKNMKPDSATNFVKFICFFVQKQEITMGANKARIIIIVIPGEISGRTFNILTDRDGVQPGLDTV